MNYPAKAGLYSALYMSAVRQLAIHDPDRARILEEVRREMMEVGGDMGEWEAVL